MLLDRPIDPGAADGARPLAQVQGFGGSLYVYEIPGATPRVYLAKHVLRSPDPLGALRLLKDPSFDPLTSAVVPGNGPPVEGSGGEVHLLERGPENLSAEVTAGSAGLLVVQRAFQPIYRATVDGVPATLRIANLHRFGVDVPAGRHRVNLWVDRRPLRISFLVSFLGLCGLAVLARRARIQSFPITGSGRGEEAGGAAVEVPRSGAGSDDAATACRLCSKAPGPARSSPDCWSGW